jgi:hypothetical protein
MATQYQVYTDGAKTYRDGVRDGCYVVDVEITPTGFDGIEGIDWENLIKME